MNQSNNAAPVVPAVDHQAVFRKEVAALKEAAAKFETGELKAVLYADLRGQHLAAALAALASSNGVTLQLPLHIDSNGEFRLVAMPKDGGNPAYGCGKFGEFVELLNPYGPRTGIYPSTLCADNGWCRINHFAAEKMIFAQAALMQQ